MKRIGSALHALLFCLLAGLAPVRAMSIVPLYLEELIDNSAVAFEGTCIDNRTDRDPATGFIVTRTTFAVRDALKGHVAATHEIKQIGGSLEEEGVHHRVPGVPRFEVGEDYVVFLAGASSAGFSSPVGLAQGRFVVLEQGGRRTVANGRDFKDMTARISDRLPPAARARLMQVPGPARELDLEEFKQLVRNHVEARR